MKRISILVTVGTVVLCHSAAASYTVPYTCRITYLPYALEYGRSGLIPGCVRYNPYALGYGYSGLAPESVRYTPYAFDARHNGLISDLGCCCLPCATWGDLFLKDTDTEPSNSEGSHRQPPPCSSWAVSEEGPRQAVQTWSYQPHQTGKAGAAVQADRIESDQRRAVVEYLNKMQSGRWEITRVLTVDNAAVSFDVLLKDKNVVVKYWNPSKIKSIKRQGSYRYKAYTNYLVDWIDYRDQFEATGGKVCHIATEDTYELLRELGTCLRSDNG